MANEAYQHDKIKMTAGFLHADAITFDDDDLTPSVAAGNIFKTAASHSAAKDITMFDNGTNGQVIVIISSNPANATTVKDGGNLLIKGDWVDAAEAILVLVFDGTNWSEISRLPSAAHAASHQNGGADEVSIAALSGEAADPQPPKTHASDHQNGGGDEINVGGLNGELADPQPPKTHGSDHVVGEADAIAAMARLYVGSVEVFNGTATASYRTLTLSGTVGANSALVMLHVNGGGLSSSRFYGSNEDPDGGCSVIDGDDGFAWVLTNPSGNVLWKTNYPGGAPTTVVHIVAYIKL